jgi:GDP-L-fucose synthase
MKKILVTGSTGLLGSAIVKKLNENQDLNLVLLNSQTDLRNQEIVDQIFQLHKPNYVYHLAAKVGGLGANMSGNAEFFRDNMLMNINVLYAASQCKEVEKVCSVLSTCIFPDGIELPIKETCLHNGEPHNSNFGYAYAKRMQEVYSRALNAKYQNKKFISVVPNNMYGENDNFSLKDGHVIPAVIHKIFLAKQNNLSTVEFWGDGSPLRQFSYAEDVARDIIFCMKNYSGDMPVNIGNPKEYSIKELVNLVKEIIGFNGKILWNIEKPNGQLKKTASTDFFSTFASNFEYVDLKEGLEKTILWFQSNYPKIRGCNC